MAIIDPYCELCYHIIELGEEYVQDRYSKAMYCIDCVHIEQWDIQDRKVC